MSKRIIPFVILLFITSSVLSREKISLAVLDFEAKNVSQESSDAVSDLLRTELFNTGRFKVIERRQVRKIIEEQQFQMSGMTDAGKAVESGRLLNVEKIMIGTVNRLGNAYFINLGKCDGKNFFNDWWQLLERGHGL